MADNQNQPTEVKLTDAVGKKYKLMKVTSPNVVLPGKFGGATVDFSTMSVEVADNYVEQYKDPKNGGPFPYLVPHTQTSSSPKV